MVIMDNLSDQDIVDIWERVSKYVDISDLKGTDSESLASEIKDKLRSNGSKETRHGKKEDWRGRGDTGRLAQAGFAERLVQTTLRDALDKISKQNRGVTEKISKERAIQIEKIRSKEIKDMTLKQKATLFSQALPEKVNQTPSGRLSVQRSVGTRTYAPQNINITFAEYRGKPSYYVTYVPTGKRLTWGLVK
jgi:hypothetical protein